MKLDVSIHFSPKNETTLHSIRDKYFEWADSLFDKDKLMFDFSENENTLLHHCFLPKKECEHLDIQPNVYELIDEIAEISISWNGLSPYGIVWDRRIMLENLKKVNGIALFIGEITGGVESEFKLCNELGIDFILIP